MIITTRVVELPSGKDYSIKPSLAIDEFKQKIDFKFIKVKEGILALAEEAKDIMVGVITANKKRQGSRGLLESSIRVESISDEQVGVGNIQYLDQAAPYWGLINYGGMVALKAQKVPGFFSFTGGSFTGMNPPDPAMAGTGPGAGGREAFFYVPRNINQTRFWMNVGNPITGIHYIEHTKGYLQTVTKVHFYNWTKTTKVQ